MEQQLLCPNCRAENLAGALTCYKCNTKMPSAPAWVGPAPFRVYDAAKDRGIAYVIAIAGAIAVLICAFLSWLGVPKGVDGAQDRGISAFDVLFGATGSRSAVGQGGVGESSIGVDVRIVLLLVLLAAIATIVVAIVKPLFPALLLAGLVMIAGPLYFFIQLAVRNNAQFNTPDLVSLLRIGFWGTIVGGAIVVGASLRYRHKQMFPQGRV